MLSACCHTLSTTSDTAGISLSPPQIIADNVLVYTEGASYTDFHNIRCWRGVRVYNCLPFTIHHLLHGWFSQVLTSLFRVGPFDQAAFNIIPKGDTRFSQLTRATFRGWEVSSFLQVSVLPSLGPDCQASLAPRYQTQYSSIRPTWS